MWFKLLNAQEQAARGLWQACTALFVGREDGGVMILFEHVRFMCNMTTG